ncbi:MAG: hypothetical protein FD126_152 [Elusimicrobia bacterium]|nr:MAG: hypothetical protein FD126_152 [Elusimicrobiota bacterium]
MIAWPLLAVALLAPTVAAQDPAPALEAAAAQIAAKLDSAYAAWPSSAPGARLFVSDSFATPMAGGRSFRSLLMRAFLNRRYTVLDVLPQGATADLEVLGWLAVDPQKAFVEARLVDSRSRVLIGLETRTVPFTAVSPAAKPPGVSLPEPPVAPRHRKFMVSGGISTHRGGWVAGAAYRPPSGRWEAGLAAGGIEKKDKTATYEFAPAGGGTPPADIFSSFSYKSVYVETRGSYHHLLDMKYLTWLSAGFGTRLVLMKLEHQQMGGGRTTGNARSERIQPVFRVGAAKDLWGDFEIQVGAEWVPPARTHGNLKIGGPAASILLGARLWQ